jgi:transglutaminase-like putative cysteine protease
VSDKSLKISGGHYSYVVHWALDYTDPSAPSRSDVSFESKRVESLAREILSGRGISLTARPRGAAQTRIAANALQAYLRQNCTYTTEMFAPEHDEDPIEMFLFRTKKGHCEYFASAMVALCQSVGIDARIVAGYLASEYNSVSGEYIVRESNAHAWVEVEMEPGRWNTMDPSPPDVIARLHRPAGGILGRLRHLYEAMEFTWVNAVVTFDEKKRSELVGAGTGWSNALARVSRFFGDPSVSPDGGLSDRDLGLIVFGAILCGFAGWIGWREFRARRRNKLRVAGLADADPTLVALMTQAGFYDRAIRALERTGFSKPRYRPPLEHAGVLAGDHPELAGVLRSLGELYYRVRYARRALNDSETAAAEALVDRLTVLAAGPGPETREGDRAAV